MLVLLQRSPSFQFIARKNNAADQNHKILLCAARDIVVFEWVVSFGQSTIGMKLLTNRELTRLDFGHSTQYQPLSGSKFSIRKFS